MHDHNKINDSINMKEHKKDSFEKAEISKLKEDLRLAIAERDETQFRLGKVSILNSRPNKCSLIHVLR